MSDFESILERCKRQEILFEEEPSRLALNKLLKETEFPINTFKVNIWRNHAIEPLLHYIDVYSSSFGYKLRYELSDYDDTFTFNKIDESDLNLIWIDLERYRIENFSDWFAWFYGRIKELRKNVKVTILIIILEEKERFIKLLKEKLIKEDSTKLPGVFIADIATAIGVSDISIYEKRYEEISGTCLNKKLHILVSRKFACHWLPTLLFAPLKAVAIDLDNTLYSGVLGEDGINNILITKEHIILQKFLKELINQGIFLILISKNEIEDVNKLFNERKDFLLKIDDFSHLEVSWEEKCKGIQRSAEKLRISENAIVFIDDNIGELSSIWLNNSSFKAIHAKENALLTVNALRFYPGIWRWNIDNNDHLRAKDMSGNIQREMILNNSKNVENYLSSLHVELIYNYNLKSEFKRLFELSRKTNQFNFSLRRTSEYEFYEFVKSESYNIVSVSLKDTISNSGIIAVIVAKKSGNYIDIIDLCISCRALGRKLEELIIFPSIINMSFFKDINYVKFHLNKGPRNKPAIEWMNRFSENVNGISNISKDRIIKETSMLKSIKFIFNYG